MVPYTRGAEFSRPVEDIFAEVNNAEKNGCLEVTLLGQNVSSYQSSAFGEKKIRLGKLCSIISRIRNLKRIRYVTSHPNDIDDELINEHKFNEKMMPFLHLPIQSGSDKILQRMNRKHTKKEYIRLIKRIKNNVPDMAFSSDFIVGYPGESDYDFQETLELIKEVKFASSYSFCYSARPGTPAATQDEIIPDEIKKNRLKHLQKILLKQQDEFNKSFLNKRVEILVTAKGKIENQYVGRTPHLQPVHIMSSSDLVGKILNIKIERLTSFSFHGKIL